MQYTLRNVPSVLDRILRQTAHDQRKSLNRVAIEALQRAVGTGQEPRKKRDLAGMSGTWKEDAQIDKVLEEQRCIDPAAWE